VPDKEKCEAFLRAQKTLAEKNRAEGKARTWFFVARAAYRRRSSYRPVMRRFFALSQ